MYYKKIITAGNFITVKKIFSARKGQASPRGHNRSPTPKDVAAVNERHSEEKLSYLLNANFKKAVDGHLTLTYSKAPQPEEAKKAVEKFLRQARTLYRREGKELKYVQVTEYKGHRIHHHIVFNDISMYPKLLELWKSGTPHLKVLYSDDLTELASYLVKETSKTFKSSEKLFGRRWTASRNLAKPKIEYEKIHFRKWKAKPPEIFRGAKLIPQKTVNGVSDFDGRPYQIAVYKLE